MNLAAVEELSNLHTGLDIIFIESGGDNLSATFSPELADITIYVIDVASGEKIPRKGGPGITKADLLVINKIDLAPMWVPIWILWTVIQKECGQTAPMYLAIYIKTWA